MKPDRAIGFEINCMKKRIGRHLDLTLSAAGFDEVTILHGWMLSYISDHEEENLCQKDFEKRFQMAKSTVTGILQLMEKKGYITRVPSPKDGRQKTIRLTDRGREVHEQTVQVIDRMHREMEEGITEEERSVLKNVMEKLNRNMEAAEARLKKEQ